MIMRNGVMWWDYFVVEVTCALDTKENCIILSSFLK